MILSWINPPPAVPWRARPASSIDILIAAAQMIDPTKNHATASNNIGFLPHISLSLAQIGALAAFAKRYAPPIHV